MPRLLRLAALLFVALMMVHLATAADQEKIIDRIVAVVDNDIILESELSQYVQYNIGSQAAMDAMRPAQLDSLRKMVLDELILQKVLLAKARLDTVTVDTKTVDGELDARIKSLTEQAGGQDRLEEYYGMPLAKLKRQFRPLVEEGLLIDKVKQEKLKGIVAGPGDVQRFWQTYKDSIPPLKDGVRLAHILLADTVSQSAIDAALHKADSVRTLITSGKMTFEDAATHLSDDPGTASKGGKLGTTNRGDLVPEYEAVAFNLKPSDISQPVASQFGVHLIRVDSRTGEKITSSHILFKIGPTDADLARTNARADSMVKAIRGGVPFGDLAAKYSTDLKTAGKGGDLGWFSPDEIPADFKPAIAGLKKGDVAGPVRTRFGAHVILVADRINARPITLEDDYDRIQRMALMKKQDEVFRKWAKDLTGETFIEKRI
ncbi:MAG TPA: peptidylprolyl isomerase [bacterium]|jgi:peptidyl-prolyl cis-trans isomerase SurA